VIKIYLLSCFLLTQVQLPGEQILIVGERGIEQYQIGKNTDRFSPTQVEAGLYSFNN